MRMIIVSGRSGSGKSTALNVLEDSGYYCIDNLPAGLLPELAERALIHTELAQPLVAAVETTAKIMRMFFHCVRILNFIQEPPFKIF